MAGDLPKGAVIVKEKVDNEAGDKLREVKKTSSFAQFLAVMKKNEEEAVVAKSGDMEVIESISSDDLGKMQKDKRLVGYDPDTKTALVLKIVFLAKKKKAEEKVKAGKGK